MRGGFDGSRFFQDPLRLTQPVKTGVYGKSGELPFNNMGEPHERARIIKFDSGKRFLLL